MAQDLNSQNAKTTQTGDVSSGAVESTSENGKPDGFWSRLGKVCFACLSVCIRFPFFVMALVLLIPYAIIIFILRLVAILAMLVLFIPYMPLALLWAAFNNDAEALGDYIYLYFPPIGRLWHVVWSKVKHPVSSAKRYYSPLFAWLARANFPPPPSTETTSATSEEDPQIVANVASL